MARSDPDRKHPLHDILCAFVADEEPALELARALFPPSERPFEQRTLGMFGDSERLWRDRLGLKPGEGSSFRFKGICREEIDEAFGALECPVYSERGKWKQLVGHLDVYIWAGVTCSYDGTASWSQFVRDGNGPFTQRDLSRPVTWTRKRYRPIAVEVKAKILSIGELIRQIQRYRHEWTDYLDSDGGEVTSPDAWVVLSPAISEGLRRLLQGQGIIGVKPSPRFLQWCDQSGLRLPDDARRIIEASTQLSLPDTNPD